MGRRSLIIPLARAKLTRWRFVLALRLQGLVEHRVAVLQNALLKLVNLLAPPGVPARKIAVVRPRVAQLVLRLVTKTGA